MRILVRILFRPTAFEGSRKIILFLTSISTVKLKKNYINCRDRFKKIILRVSNRRLNASSSINKICVKSIGYLMWFS